MPPTTEQQSSSPASSGSRFSLPAFATLILCGLASAWLYVDFTALSDHFRYDNDFTLRPIPQFLGMFAVAFVVYLLAIWIARRAKQDWRLLTTIVGFAIAFRIIVLASVPVQEVDIYRYIWDGAVTTQGISPFRYPPGVVESAVESGTEDWQLQKLVAICKNDPALHEILKRVHFDHLPTVYPATSQVVFAISERTTPDDVSLQTRVRIMKGWLIAFDVATIFLVIKLLSMCRLPTGLSVIYAWCPLLIKEIANSGHLDSIAVFLATLSVYLLARCLLNQSEQKKTFFNPGLLLASAALAAGVGGKLFPVVLVPLFCFVTARRFGWQAVVGPAVVFLAVTVALFWPMLPERSDTPRVTANQTASSQSSTSNVSSDPSVGMTTFLKSWEMNDLLFMIVIENLKTAAEFPGNKSVWFSVAPDSWRDYCVDWTAQTFSVSKREAPFFFTRLVTSLLFLVLACWLAWRATRRDDLRLVFETAFLTLAWFWLLSPTQNPWYWTWALPFLPFMRNRAWLMMSGLLLVYYLRFWLLYNYSQVEILGTGYKGVAFFDFVIPWFEFGVFLVWLPAEWVIRAWFDR